MSIVLDGSNVSTTGVPNSGTAVSASGTAVDFTGIPAGTKRITVMFNGVSTNGSDNFLIQIGSGSVTTSGYLSSFEFVYNGGTPAGGNATNGFGVYASDSTAVKHGTVTLYSLNSGNTWICSGVVGASNNTGVGINGGSVSLSGTLDRVRITTTGSNTFDSGSINILYE